MRLFIFFFLSSFYLITYAICDTNDKRYKGPITRKDITHYDDGTKMPIREIDKAEVYEDFPILENLLAEKIAYLDSTNEIRYQNGLQAKSGIELSILKCAPKDSFIIDIAIGVDGPHIIEKYYCPIKNGDLCYFIHNGHTVLFRYNYDHSIMTVKEYPTKNGVIEVPIYSCCIFDPKAWIYTYANGILKPYFDFEY